MIAPKSPTPPDLGTVSRRQLRFGFYGLLAFVSLGVLLEAFHGFKLGFYLDVENEARRLSLRLAHAHGALLSLLHVVCALVTSSANAPPAAAAARSFSLLAAATVLLPGGFLLGGLFSHDGDPGLGILLVPFGAVLLFSAILVMARGVGKQSALTLREIAHGSDEYDASFALRRRVLREPLGLTPKPEERAEEAPLIHLGAFDGARLVGCLMLHDLGAGEVRMRQVAVDFERQRAGVGKQLVHFSEAVALRRGFRKMVLHARDTAVPFYDQLGYTRRGEPFVEVTIPHLLMEKVLHD
jgi:GNAT superfamily N-acetyltransferase